MWNRGFFVVVLAVVVASGAFAQTTTTLAGVEGYGNFHAGGVVATIADDSDGDATASLEWRRTADATFRLGHPLDRIDTSHFAGSLWWLDPETSYTVRVTVADPDGVVGAASATTTFSTRDEALVEPGLRTLYVAPDGDDDNLGTDPSLPLLTIQEAADRAQPGDLVLIADGVYREGVTVSTSGTAAQPIVFRGSGDGAVLDGADEGIAAGVSWSPQANGVYSVALGFSTGHVVTEQGRLYRYGSLPELEALGAGAPGGFVFNGATLYVKLLGGSSPSAHTMHVARLENGFYLDSVAHVRVENLEIRHFGAGDYGKAVYIRYSSDCAVRSCEIHGIGSAGVWFKGGERNLVEHNTLRDSSIFDWPWALTKGSSAENNGVALTDDVGRGTVVRRNHFSGTFNGIGPCGGSPPPGGLVTTETDVYENTFSRHTDDALEPEGYCANVRLWGNIIEDVHMAFAVAPAAPGPTYIVRNVAFNVGNTRTSQLDGYTASALKINSGYPTPIGPLYLYHNTVLTEAPETEALYLLNPGYSTFIVMRNNVFAGTRYVLNKVNPVILDLDWDALSTTDPSRFVKWEGVQHADLASLRSATGQEINGLAAPPDLAEPPGGDFTPNATSPLIDRGVVIPGVNDGFAGVSPDIGAVEWRGEVFSDGFESGNTSAWSAQTG